MWVFEAWDWSRPRGGGSRGICNTASTQARIPPSPCADSSTASTAAATTDGISAGRLDVRNLQLSKLCESSELHAMWYTDGGRRGEIKAGRLDLQGLRISQLCKTVTVWSVWTGECIIGQTRLFQCVVHHLQEFPLQLFLLSSFPKLPKDFFVLVAVLFVAVVVVVAVVTIEPK